MIRNPPKKRLETSPFAATTMGATNSKPISAIESDNESSVFNEKSTVQDYDISKHLQKLNLTLEPNSDELTSISLDALAQWEKQLLSDPKNRLAQSAFSKHDITSVIGKTGIEANLKDQYLFNVVVDTIGSPSFLNNQKLSGRCWIFASSNVLRSHVIKNYNLKEDSFQLSQSYLFFYDKLEKANLFLEHVIEYSEEPLDSRLSKWLFQDPVGDGGQWDMIINLVSKYGIVPNEVFPDSAQSTSSSRLNYIVTEKLREFGLVLRELVNNNTPKVVVQALKASMNKSIYNIIALALGNPPKPSDPFVWEILDKNGKYLHFETSALDFYKTHVQFDVSQHFSLLHDPRNDYDQLYTVDILNNIHGGKPVEYVNLQIDEIKEVAIKMLKDNEPMFFGCDVGKFGNSQSGILDTTAYDYELGFGVSLKSDKADRLRSGSSQMTHAMVITGVHLDPTTGKPVRWKIENSWGDAVGDKGYFVMTDEWFNEYVFQIVTNKKYVDKKVKDLIKKKDFKTLPYYDPMGSLA